MALRTLKSSTAMITLMPHPTFTTSQLKAYPHGAPYVALFEALCDEGKEVIVHEIEHAQAVAEAQALVVRVDAKLDAFAGRLSTTLLDLAGNDRKSGLYLHYFPKALNETTRPVLGDQLDTMKKWLLSLTKSNHAALTALVSELTALLTEADTVKAARDAALHAKREFRDVGERQEWLDRLNAARKDVYGQLSKLPHEHKELPPNFADRFFLADQRRDSEEDTVESVQAELELNRQAVLELEARLVEVQAAEAEAQQEADARAAQEAALVEMDKAVAALNKQRAQLRSQLASAR
ncbi:hypothetical protein [Chondromyces apiculatus]|uniref:Uncharacterized protein n=1 Tax=Chondromyces apiculatus DSM 436 TaxID=1192034 RepID=A0A017T924_9BACT|nr:hypothetical protein [Chondromyces apiculatus]EYF05076.1 Hypothetical protein CAP_3666 [Chondromyces apiculatus DSM 436]